MTISSFGIIWATRGFKQKTAYEISLGLVGSEMCIRDRDRMLGIGNTNVLRTAVQLHLCIFFCFDLLSAAAVLV